MKKNTTLVTICYPFGEISGSLLFQILTVFLLKIIADTFGMTEAIFAAMAYVVIITVCGYSMIHYFIKNNLNVALATLMTYIALGVRCSSLGFYFQDYIDQQTLTTWINQWGLNISREDAYVTGLAVLVVIGSLMQFLSIILFSLFLEKHENKRVTSMLCLMVTAFLTALCYLPQPDDVTIIYLVSMLKSIAFAPIVPLLWTMASGFSEVTSVMKIGLGIGGALAALLLLCFGYVSVTADVLSWHTVQSIRWVSSILPALLFISGLAILWPSNNHFATFQPPRAT